MQKYKSLGQMLKKKDFAYLLNDMKNMIGTAEFEKLKTKTTENPISELDELLFNIPNYCLNENGMLNSTSIDVLKFCIDNGANPNAYMKNGENTFLKCCGIKDSSLLRALLNSGVEVVTNHTDGRCNDALFYAVMNESIDNIDLLVTELGFDVNKKNIISEEQTVLHYACGHTLIDSINKLVELKADLYVKDSAGRTPKDMMQFINDEDIREEYSDEPETLNKWDKALELVEKLYVETPSNTTRKLKRQY